MTLSSARMNLWAIGALVEGTTIHFDLKSRCV